ncbi:MAG TPA: hypothetical protein VFX98_05980 [Longimicrobiaceae bacterium]|nr:hypothetical protein [Longimicrobiaceae bacterium]
MKPKLTLDLEALAVTSFEMEEKALEEGPGCPWSQPLSCKATLHTCTD